MDSDNIREYDKTYADRLIGDVEPLENNICKEVKEQVLNDIIPYIADDDDSIDELTIKKIHLEEEIFPKLFNFRVKCEEYDNIYIDICQRLQSFTIAQTEIDEEKLQETVKTQKEIDREKRLKFYSKK